jgi:dihydrodipicolinate synthase/N-acetylneuraminate lyase
MNLMGMGMGECRLPLVGLSEKNRETLKAELEKLREQIQNIE